MRGSSGGRCTGVPVPGGLRGVGTLLAGMVAVAALVVTPMPPAVGAPSDQPGGTTGVLDSAELDALQNQAALVQADLQRRQTQVEAAQAQLVLAQAAADEADAVLADADGELAGRQAAVAAYAIAAYADGGALNEFTVLLQADGDPGEVVSALGYLDAVERYTARMLAAAEELRQAALGRQATADAALAAARAQADAVAAEAADLEDAAAAVTGQLDAALASVDRQLAVLQEEQLAVNRQTVANWQNYLAQLAEAGIGPPPASALANPAGSLPDGLVALRI